MAITYKRHENVDVTGKGKTVKFTITQCYKGDNLITHKVSMKGKGKGSKNYHTYNN